MNPWTNRPDRGDHPTQLQLLRCRPSHPLLAIITADDVLGAYTHYWKGRTRICTHPTCDACDAHHAPRWYGYLAVVSTAMTAPTLVEITPSCIEAIESYLHEYRTLRGAQLTLKRANPKANSRLQATLEPSAYRDGKLPAAPDVRAQLERIWEIKVEIALHEHPPQLTVHNENRQRHSNGGP
jgi:hypothetical protein